MISKVFCNHFFQKFKGLLVKVGLSFGCMRLNHRSLGAKILALLNKL
ncbi:Hypothetical protein HPV225_0033 [Helicobacter pylori v225d]|nr:Hypothetical protein HPV225_0033 [Helicobacter pylori v225d]